MIAFFNVHTQYLDCRSGCIAQSKSQACPGVCVSKSECHVFMSNPSILHIHILQSGRCLGICGSTLGCFGSSVENNDCGVDCSVSVINS